MKLKNRFVGLLVIAITLMATVASGQIIKANEANAYIGQKTTVCGFVASSKYSDKSTGRPTFLNFDKPFPRHDFTIVIWGNNRQYFGRPEKQYKGKDLCVTGQIESFKGKAQIVAERPSEIAVIN
ncbi:DNA-binding protein [Desulfosediminicola ganghwensis]|uniref:DNA-binding protein n=1 Tax=Desulfosediminicola ganghwensis TaxID=2569540 RepID=UPI0010AD92CC|nr:DNA-binding protein [Desulfosediminicola ganghwensis]